jgi:hypothetical protein
VGRGRLEFLLLGYSRIDATSVWLFCGGRVWGAVPVVRLIAFRFPGAGLLTTDDGASWWPGPDAA